MSLEEAKEIFNIVDLSDDIELKKIYKNLVFLFHPDAHPENSQEYTEKIKAINKAYSILEHNISLLRNNEIRTQEEEYKQNKQIKKEQILTEIVVKSYYQSQNDISQLKVEMLNKYISRASKLDIKRAKAIQSELKPITIETAYKETEVMNKFIRQNVKNFMDGYGLQTIESGNTFLFMMMEPLYFLDFIPDWYEKVLAKDNLPKIVTK